MVRLRSAHPQGRDRATLPSLRSDPRPGNETERIFQGYNSASLQKLYFQGRKRTPHVLPRCFQAIRYHHHFGEFPRPRLGHRHPGPGQPCCDHHWRRYDQSLHLVNVLPPVTGGLYEHPSKAGSLAWPALRAPASQWRDRSGFTPDSPSISCPCHGPPRKGSGSPEAPPVEQVTPGDNSPFCSFCPRDPHLPLPGK